MDGATSPAEGLDAAETIQEYYGALRAGEPLHPYFADAGTVVKVGIGDRMVGPEAVAEGLREQTRTTDDWTVESRDLHVGVEPAASAGEDGVGGEGRFAWFGDDVFMAWTDTDRRIRFEFETRWTGAMVRHDGDWRFVEMHVSTPGET